jgi:beta-glucosidase
MIRRTFPDGFVWGAATSAYQIEGATREDGRGESIWDRFARSPSAILDGANGDVACDHYHRYRQDAAMMRSFGLHAYRFSVAWPRILPRGRGSANSRGLDFYSRLIDELLEYGITPFLTLYHWDLPQALQDAGGWASRETAHAFVEYAWIVSRHLGDRVKNWITHNEPECAAHLGYRRGIHAPGLRDWNAALRACHHLLLSHGWSVPVIRANASGGQVGITLNLSPGVPASSSPEDLDACRHFDGSLNRWFLDPLYRRQYPADVVADYLERGHLPPDGLLSIVRPDDMAAIAAPTDFLGVNYYSRTVVRSDRIAEAENRPRTAGTDPSAEWTDMGWEVYPDGLFELLVRLQVEYAVPTLYVTENGASYSQGPDSTLRVADAKRIRYLRQHFFAARRALDAGVPLRGYFVWSLLDNFEWDRGYSQRFGITWVDYETQLRIPKDSALWYARVIAENGIPSD